MATGLEEQIRAALNQARKARDRLRTDALSLALSELKNREIEAGQKADEEMVRAVLARGIKQRRESSEQMRAGNREDLAVKEEGEAAVLAEFLPPEMNEDEVRAMVRAIVAEGPIEMGPLMGRLMPHIRGRFDGKVANRIVREELAT